MGVRLNKVLTELNIGLRTAVYFLKNKKSLGEMKDDVTPNTKISDEQYEALVGEFKGDKAVKTLAASLFSKKPKEKKVVAKGEELLSTEPRPQFKPVGKIDLDSIVKKPASKKVEEPAPVVEPAPEPVAKETSAKTTAESHPVDEVKKEAPQPAPVKETPQTPVAEKASEPAVAEEKTADEQKVFTLKSENKAAHRSTCWEKSTSTR